MVSGSVLLRKFFVGLDNGNKLNIGVVFSALKMP